MSRLWQALPIYGEVLDLEKRATQRWDDLTTGVLRYRLQLMALSNRPRHLDGRLRDEFNQLQSDLDLLHRKTRGIWPKLPWTAHSLRKRWRRMLSRMEDFIGLVERAESGASFYSKMVESKEAKRKRRETRVEIDGAMEHSAHSLVRTINYLLLRERAGESITQGSSLLRIDELASRWIRELKSALTYKAGHGSNWREVVRRVEALREEILESVTLAERVAALEDRFQHLMSAWTGQGSPQHTGLGTSQMARPLRILQDEVPKSWASAEWNVLEAQLDRITGVLDQLEKSLPIDEQPPEDQTEMSGSGSPPASPGSEGKPLSFPDATQRQDISHLQIDDVKRKSRLFGLPDELQESDTGSTSGE